MLDTATDQLYAITKNDAITRNGKVLMCAAGDHCIALAGPYDSEYDSHPAGSWLVLLGFDAAKAVQAADDERHSTFIVRTEEEARQWLDLLARLYFAQPPRPLVR